MKKEGGIVKITSIEYRLQALEKEVWKLNNPLQFKKGDDVIIFFNGKLAKAKYECGWVVVYDNDGMLPHFKYNHRVQIPNMKDNFLIEGEAVILKPEDLKEL